MAADRAQLEAWIAETEANLRRLRIAIAPAALVAGALMLVDRVIGGFALGTVVIVALYGFWIMSSHVSDWETKLEELDKPRPVGRAVKPR